MTSTAYSRTRGVGASSRTWLTAVLAVSVGMGLVAVLTRPPLPIDETRYLGVAWEMWQRGEWLVPYANGEPYSHKPPLVFWLILAGWKIFGVSETWARLVGPLAGTAALWMTTLVARRLWNDDEGHERGLLAAIILLGTPLWALYSSATMFDTLVTCCVLASVLGVLMARDGSALAGWATFAGSLGLGILVKGPVMLVYALPIPLVAPWLFTGPRMPPSARWYGGLAAGMVGGAVVALLWALPAAAIGGAAYGDDILWHQTSSRVVESLAHRRPVWWYVPLLPPLLLPWIVWPALWRGVTATSLLRRPTVERLCLVWFGCGFVVFSAISGKQMHYFLPLLPALALFSAGSIGRMGNWAGVSDLRVPGVVVGVAGIGIAIAAELLEEGAVHSLVRNFPVWGPEFGEVAGMSLVTSAAILGLFPAARTRGRAAHLAAVTILLFSSLHLLGLPSARDAFDLAPVAVRVAAVQARGSAVAYAGTYHGEFNFLGRLKRPVAQVSRTDFAAWLAQNPEGRIVVEFGTNDPELARLKPEYTQRDRNRVIVILGRESL